MTLSYIISSLEKTIRKKDNENYKKLPLPNTAPIIIKTVIIIFINHRTKNIFFRQTFTLYYIICTINNHPFLVIFRKTI